VATVPSLENQLNYCTVFHVPVPSVVEVPVLIMSPVACRWRCKDRYLLLEVLGWVVLVVGVCRDGWRLLLEV